MSAALFAAVMALSFTACAGGGENENAGGNGGMQAEALARVAFTIYDNSAGMDLLSRLPLSLEFSDYNNTEKIAYLPDGEELDTSDAPSSCDPAVGDITVYAPWGNIAIFYRDFGRFRSPSPTAGRTAERPPTKQRAGRIRARRTIRCI